MCCHLETPAYLCVGALEGASSNCEALRESILVDPEGIHAMCDQQWICRKVKRLRAGFNGTRSCEDAMSTLIVWRGRVLLQDGQELHEYSSQAYHLRFLILRQFDLKLYIKIGLVESKHCHWA
eukprot:4093167-Pleurochrysis_carterae.AAC.1